MSVCGTGTYGLKRYARFFSAVWGQRRWSPKGPPHHGSGSGRGFTYARHRPNRLEGHATCPRRLPSCVTPRTIDRRWRRNINRLPFGYPFRVHLRVPANPGRTTLPQVPLGLRGEGFSPSFRILMPAFSLPPRPAALAGPPSPYSGKLPYRQYLPEALTRGFGGWLEPRYIFGAERLGW